MKTKIEIKSIFGEVLFTYENENATIKDAVQLAVKENANLSGADLSGANLQDADLRNSDLGGADLGDANLGGADLRNANLGGADLRNANLRNADLRNANLRNADLRNAENKETAYVPLHCKWSFSIIGDKIQIGCKDKTIEEWESFFNSNEEYSTNRNTYEFKQIQAVYEACKAYLTFLKK